MKTILSPRTQGSTDADMRVHFSLGSRIQFLRVFITILMWIPAAIYVNHSGKKEAIITVKIVGLKVVIQFHIAVNLYQTTFNGYLQSLKFCVSARSTVPVIRRTYKVPGF